MTQLVYVLCRRRGSPDELPWYEGSARDIMLDRDEIAIEDDAYLCGDCLHGLDPEEQPRWRSLKPSAEPR